MKRLYVVVRSDLPPGLQLAQACHAAREFAADYPGDLAGENLVALSCPNELSLWRLTDDARLACVPVTPFREPDLGGELTAAAFGNNARKLLSSLPLALRAPRAPRASQDPPQVAASGAVGGA